MKKTFPVPLFVLTFFLLFQGCQDNDIPGTYPEIGSMYQQGFSLEGFGDPVIRENLVVDWSDPNEFTDTDGTILYEFDAQVGNGTVLEG